MDCTKYREWMMLELDGELPEAQGALLVAHFGECEACRAERELLRLTKRGLGLLAEETPPDEFSARWRAAVKGLREKRRPPVKMISFAASLVLLAGVAALSLRTVQPPAKKSAPPEAQTAVMMGAHEPAADGANAPAIRSFAADPLGGEAGGAFESDVEFLAEPTGAAMESTAESAGPDASAVIIAEAAPADSGGVEAVVTVPDDDVPMVASCAAEIDDAPICEAAPHPYTVSLGAQAQKSLLHYASSLTETDGGFVRFFEQRMDYFELVMTTSEVAALEELMLELGISFKHAVPEEDLVLVQVSYTLAE